MRTIIIVVISALGATASVPTQAQYYGGLPLTAVRGNLASDPSNLLFGSRFSVRPMRCKAMAQI